MTDDLRPRRAAATATFVALPPSDFANVATFARGTPSCSGYRSTETRPIVRTSKSGMSVREIPGTGHVARGIVRLGRRPRERDVLLEHAPARVSRFRERVEHADDARAALAEPPEEPTFHRVGVAHPSLAHGRGELSVGVLQMHVPDAAWVRTRDRRRIAATDEDHRSVETQRHLAVAENAVDRLARLD